MRARWVVLLLFSTVASADTADECHVVDVHFTPTAVHDRERSAGAGPPRRVLARSSTCNERKNGERARCSAPVLPSGLLPRRNSASLEAGVKYLILSALSTGFLVYGITWIFGVTGETNLARVSAVLVNPGVESGPALFGMLLVLVALGFKIAAVPFQIWVPDV